MNEYYTKFAKSYSKLLFRNSDSIKQRWDLLVMSFALVNAFCVPLSLSFEPEFLESTIFLTCNYFIDTCFLFDIFITFRTVFVDEFGDECEDSWKIARNYIYGQFLLDVLATFPFDVVIDTSTTMSESGEETDNKWILIFGILKLGRLLRLNKII